MRCSSCGSEIPFAGQVCPFCHRDKSADQAAHGQIVFGVLVGSVLGYFAGDTYGGPGCGGDFFGMLGAGGGAMVGAIGMGIFSAMNPRALPPPPSVSIDPRSLPASSQVNVNVQAPAIGTAEQRLTALNELKAKGLISEQEFSDRRKAIMDQL